MSQIKSVVHYKIAEDQVLQESQHGVYSCTLLCTKECMDAAFRWSAIQHLTNICLSCRAILLLHNCAAHPSGCVIPPRRANYCVFLTPNTTSIIQPLLDGGILATTNLM